MYCRYCGRQLPDGSKFCSFCGKNISFEENKEDNIQDVTNDITQSINEYKSPSPDKNKKHKYFIISGIILAVIITGTVICFIQYQRNSWSNWVNDYQNTISNLYLSDKEQDTLNDYLLQANNADSNTKKMLKQEMLKLKEQVKKENDNYKTEIKNGLNSITNDYDLTYAFDDEIKKIENYKSEINTLSNKHQYPKALSQIDSCKKLMESISKIKTGWNVSVVQKDISQYPKVKLYLGVTDQSGNPVENLEQKIFFLSQKDAANGKYIKKAITNAVQLNKNESININLVADVSASMSSNIYSVQSILNNFLSTVQFGVGDKVALTQFNDTSYVTQPFTNDKNSLISQVNNLYPSGDTKLYDTIIESILNVAGQSGAKCVIAFTDGYDNRSASSPDDVVRVAKNCGIPVFIIGIGYDVDNVTLNQIALSSGGYYTNITSFNTMQDIYSSIYTQQKKTYCLEYTADDDNMMNPQNLSIYLRGDKNGGKTEFSFKAADDFFDILLNHYQHSYIDALSAGDPSIMAQAGYVNTDGGVYKETKAYIQKNKETLAEQLLQAEVTNVKYVDDNTYEISSREIYDIQQYKDYDTEIADSTDEDMTAAKNILFEYYYPEELIHQKIAVHKVRTLGGHYTVKKSNDGKWQISDFTQNYDILGTNVYTAYMYY